MASRRHLGRRSGVTDDYQTVMALWVTHMRVHHSDYKTPDWDFFGAEGLAASEAKYFEVTAEEILLRKIFGEKDE